MRIEPSEVGATPSAAGAAVPGATDGVGATPGDPEPYGPAEPELPGAEPRVAELPQPAATSPMAAPANRIITTDPGRCLTTAGAFDVTCMAGRLSCVAAPSCGVFVV